MFTDCYKTQHMHHNDPHQNPYSPGPPVLQIYADHLLMPNSHRVTHPEQKVRIHLTPLAQRFPT